MTSGEKKIEMSRHIHQAVRFDQVVNKTDEVRINVKLRRIRLTTVAVEKL